MLHDLAGAKVPFPMLLFGDQIHATSRPREQYVAWLLRPCPQHPGRANGTTEHSQKIFGHRKMEQPVGYAFGEQVPLPVHQLPEESPPALWIPHCFHWSLKPNLSRPSHFVLELVVDSFFRSSWQRRTDFATDWLI